MNSFALFVKLLKYCLLRNALITVVATSRSNLFLSKVMTTAVLLGSGIPLTPLSMSRRDKFYSDSVLYEIPSYLSYLWLLLRGTSSPSKQRRSHTNLSYFCYTTKKCTKHGSRLPYLKPQTGIYQKLRSS